MFEFLRRLFGAGDRGESASKPPLRILPAQAVKPKSRPKQTPRRTPKASLAPAIAYSDLRKMVRELKTKTNPLDRHFLMLNIEGLAYRDRKADPKKRELFRSIAETHLAEFPVLARALRKDLKDVLEGGLPSVPTFQKYATVLTEDGEYRKAIEVCQQAISYGLDDGTKAGWEGRIERIRRKMEKQR